MDDDKSGAGAGKFNLLTDEELMLAKKPSFFAFFGMYVLALFVGAAHFFFNWIGGMESENFILELMINVTASDLGRAVGFPILILFIAWINRWLNMSTSGKWFTSTLIIIAFLPLIFGLNDFFMDDESRLPLPEEYPYEIAGLAWFGILVLSTVYYQRSFSYAITSDALIFKRSFMLSRAQRRVLYDNIQDLTSETGVIGTVFRFGTVVPLTGSGLGIGEESMGISGGGGLADTVGGDSSTEGKAKRGFIKIVFALLSAQRTVRVIKADPSQCFFGVRGHQEVYDKVAEQWRAHDPAKKMEEMKDLLAQQVEQQAAE